MRKSLRAGFLSLVLCLFTIGFVNAQNRYLPFTKQSTGAVDRAQAIKPTRVVNDVRGQYLEVRYNFKGAMVSDQKRGSDTYNYLHIYGFGKMGQTGAPALPMRNDIIAVPQGVNVTVDVIESEFIEVSGYYVHPALEPARDTEGVPDPEFKRDEKLYSTDAFFPAKIADVLSVQTMRGMPMATIQVRPVQFNPITKKLRVYSKIVYRVNYNGKSVEFNQRSDEKTPYSNFILNKESVSVKRSVSRADDGSKDYIIVTIDRFMPAARKLATWKSQLGYSVDIVSKGSWTSDEVMEAIHSRYKNWSTKPGYFVIIGDNEHVPGQDLQIDGETYASDLYYACMDGAGDYTPDMAHGRISVKSPEQANVVIDKIVNYEKNPVSDASFYQNGVNCAQFQDVARYEAPDGYAARRFCHTSEDIRDYITGRGYDVERIYYTKSTNTPTNWNKGYYSKGEKIPDELLRKNGFNWNGGKDEITTSINAGKFYLFHRDHGYAGGTGWAHPEFLTNHIDALTNGDKLPVVFSINCHTGEFRLPECFAEKFLRKEGGGAVGVVGAAYYSLSGNNDGFSLGMVDAIWPNPGIIPVFGTGSGIPNPGPSGVANSIRTMGDVVNQGLVRMTQTWDSNESYKIYTYRLFHYFGDPAMKIWVKKPEAAAAQFPADINCGATTLTINNVVPANALVTIVQNGEIIAKANAVGGVATLNFDAIDNKYQTVVTVSAQDYDPVEKSYNVKGCTNAAVANFRAWPKQIIAGEALSVVTFTDESQYGPASWSWNFGSSDIEYKDGTSNSSQNPKVKYTKAGKYTVSLDATNANGTGKETKDNYITVYSKSADADCKPVTQNLSNAFGLGIRTFILKDIIHSSGTAVEDGGYKDFTNIFTNLVPGHSYDFTVKTGKNPERVRVYADLNRNGKFEDTESLIYSDEFKYEYKGSLTFPYAVTMGEMIRLRVISDYKSMDINSGCYSPYYGQVEDYSIVFVEGKPYVNTNGSHTPKFDGVTLAATLPSDGYSALTERGFVIAKHNKPTIDDIKEVVELSKPDFEKAVTGLDKNTDYYFRAFAKNKYGLSYGHVEKFSTLYDQPTAQPTDFAVNRELSTWIALEWKDAKTGLTPWGYLIKWSETSYDDITAPTDGVTDNGANSQMIQKGEEFAVLKNMKNSTKYYFKIFAYTNEGASIDYLTTGTIPQTEGTTLGKREYLPITYRGGEKIIKNFKFHTINNGAARPNKGYNDFTSMSTDVAPNKTYTMTLDVSHGNYTYYYTVWIDWNCDGWFDSTTDKYEFAGLKGGGVLSRDITVPADAKLGETTLRITGMYNKAPSSFGSHSYGSSEDYTVNVDADAKVKGLWTGAVSNDWNEKGNWDANEVPTDCDVTIPGGTPRSPLVTTDIDVNGYLRVRVGATIMFDGGDSDISDNIINQGSIMISNGAITVAKDLHNSATSIFRIEGGTLNCNDIRRDYTSTWAKGTIRLLGGTINARDVKFSLSDVNGYMSEGFTLNLKGSFGINQGGWMDGSTSRITGGKINFIKGDDVDRYIFASGDDVSMTLPAITINAEGQNINMIHADEKANNKTVTILGDLEILKGSLNTVVGDNFVEKMILKGGILNDGGSLNLDNTKVFVENDFRSRSDIVTGNDSEITLSNATESQRFDVVGDLTAVKFDNAFGVDVFGTATINKKFTVTKGVINLGYNSITLGADATFVTENNAYFTNTGEGALYKMFDVKNGASQSFAFPVNSEKKLATVTVTVPNVKSVSGKVGVSACKTASLALTSQSIVNAWLIKADKVYANTDVNISIDQTNININGKDRSKLYVADCPKTGVWNNKGLMLAADQPIVINGVKTDSYITAMYKPDAPAVSVSDQAGLAATFVGATDKMEYKIDGKDWQNIETDTKLYLNGPRELYVRYKATDKSIAGSKTADLDMDDTTVADPVLDNNVIDENKVAGTKVGDITILGAPSDAVFTAALAADSPNKDLFSVNSGAIVTDKPLDYENAISYTIKVDINYNAKSWTKEFVINVNNVNETPTNVELTPANIAENMAVNSEIGTLSTIDPDTGDTFTYTIDNTSDNKDAFVIIGDKLCSKIVFNKENKDLYKIKVRSTDKGGEYLVKELTITIDNINDIPTDISLSELEVNEKLPVDTEVANIIVADEDTGDAYTYELLSDAGGKFKISGNKILVAAKIYYLNGLSNTKKIKVAVTETVSGHKIEKEFTITILNVNDKPYIFSHGKDYKIDENVAVGTKVATLDYSDLDGDDVTFELLTNPNGLFKFDGDNLITAKDIDFETYPTVDIKVKADDGNGGTHTADFTITVNNVNEKPGDITLSAKEIAENSAVDTEVGTLSSTDPDAGDAVTLSLEDGVADNNQFAIVGGKLVNKAVFDYETKSSYTIKVKATDNDGLFTEKEFVINVTDVNEATLKAITLSSDNIAENVAAGTVVGSFVADVSRGAGESMTYSFDGNKINDFFVIDGDKLKSKIEFNFEDKASYDISIVGVDSEGTKVKAAFTINITDVNETPTDITFNSNGEVKSSAKAGYEVGTLTAADPDAANTFTFVITENDSKFEVKGNKLVTKADATNLDAKESVKVKATDNGGLFIEKTFEITVQKATSITDEAADNQISMYPNPAVNKVTVTISDMATINAEIFVYSLTGELVMYDTVKGNNASETVLNIDNLPVGEYIVVVRTDNSTKRMKLIKI
ncbi:MAG: C25 family cysteine peptidase [Bacteroidales bacterium]|jgi:PKD repeat protein|nr:C25 family cysteine peptidase [Bacteroidales bacterium]